MFGIPNPDLSIHYATSKVEHLIAFTAIFCNVFTVHVRKRLFMNFQCKFRHHRSIPWPRFSYRVRNFGDLATFSIDFFCILYAESSPVPVCLTYWPGKYTTRVDPHGDNFHQVWSWYGYPLPSYSVLAADTLRDLVTLIFDLLTSHSCHSCHTYMGPKMSTPKRHFIARKCGTVSFDVFCVKIGARLGGSLFQEPPHQKNSWVTLSQGGAKSRHAQKRNPLTDLDKILHGGRYPRHNHLHKFWWPSG